MFTCKLSKAEILSIIIDEFEKAKAEVDRPGVVSHRAVYREEALLDLLRRIPIYESEEKFYTLHGTDRETGDFITLQHVKAASPSAAFKAAEEAFPNVYFFSCNKYREEDSECVT